MAAAGYQAERAGHHYRVIDSLELTLGVEASMVRKRDLFRKKRNIANYEQAGTVSEMEAEEMRQLAATLRSNVVTWVRKNHPGIAP